MAEISNYALPDNTDRKVSQDESEIVLMRTDLETGKPTIDRNSYIKLHRATGSKHRYSVGKIKERFEENRKPETNFSSFGYPKAAHLTYPRVKSLNFDVDSNSLRKDIKIVQRAPSIDSLDQINRNLDDFTMEENKAKKSTLRKMFSIFSKDKKKKDERKKNFKERVLNDNAQNESTSIELHRPLPVPIQKQVNHNVDKKTIYDDTNYSQNHQMPLMNLVYPSQKIKDQSSDNNEDFEKYNNQPTILSSKILSPTSIEQNLNKWDKDYLVVKPYLQETYGTVKDNINQKSKIETNITTNQQRPLPNVPSTKLRLPSNREIYDIPPKLKLPTISDSVSTDKIIATKLLNQPTSPRRKSTTESLQLSRSQTPTNQGVQLSLPVTPVHRRQPITLNHSPQKEEMKKKVEEYYWKQLKKLKEEEDNQVAMKINNDYYQQQQDYNTSIQLRRSRSLSPTTRKNLSFPKERAYNEVIYGNMGKQSIPENQEIGFSPSQQMIYSNRYEAQTINRNEPDRRSLDLRNQNRPIFRRGSLNKQEIYEGNTYNKRVSFSNGQIVQPGRQYWPTKDGYTQNPPQRRILDRRDSVLEDEVFYPEPIYGQAPVYHQDVVYAPLPGQVRQMVSPGRAMYINSGNLQRPSVYSSIQSLAEPIYGQARQITIHNKYADFNGRIHDDGNTNGVIYAQLQNTKLVPNQQNFMRERVTSQSAYNMSSIYGYHRQPNSSTGTKQSPYNGLSASGFNSTSSNLNHRQMVNEGNYDKRPLPPAPTDFANRKNINMNYMLDFDSEKLRKNDPSKEKSKRNVFFGK